MSELRYRSTGKPVFPQGEKPTEEEMEQRRRAARENSPAYMNMKAREEIAARHDEARARDPKKEYDASIKWLDGNFKDLTHNPSTNPEFARRLHAKAIDAAEKGEQMDWRATGSKVGEEMRQEMGAPTSDERARQETLAELRRSRGIE